MAECEAFIAAPSEEALEKCTKEQLLKIAEHYSVVVGDKRLKENVKTTLKVKLVELGIMTTDPSEFHPVTSTLPVQAQGLTFEQQKELLLLQMEHDERKRQLDIKKQIELAVIHQQTEKAKLDLQGCWVAQGKASSEDQGGQGTGSGVSPFDVRNLRLVPHFNEREPDVFFLVCLSVFPRRGAGRMRTAR